MKVFISTASVSIQVPAYCLLKTLSSSSRKSFAYLFVSSTSNCTISSVKNSLAVSGYSYECLDLRFKKGNVTSTFLGKVLKYQFDAMPNQHPGAAQATNITSWCWQLNHIMLIILSSNWIIIITFR